MNAFLNQGAFATTNYHIRKTGSKSRLWAENTAGSLRITTTFADSPRHRTSGQIEYEPNDVCVLRITGTLKQSEFAAAQKNLASKIDIGSKPRVLAIVESFEGWERGADWNDLDFLVSHSGEIARIAIVADPKWETQALAFAGAGVRRAPVKFCRPAELEQARTWLSQ